MYNQMLKELISKIFANNQANVLHLLEKYELHKFISDFSEKIDMLESYDVQKNTIGALASSLLTRINVVLEKIESNEDKERLEYILSEITTVFIYQLLQKEGISQKQVLIEIKNALITVCEINNWDIELLLKKTKIDLLHTLSVRLVDTSIEKIKIDSDSKLCYYKWLGKDDHFKEFTYDLKDKKIIKSVEEFKKLFNKHTGKIQIRMSSSHIDFIVLLFDQMKKENLIRPCGTKGHFFPLKMYCVDFDKKVLFKKEPKRIKELVKRDSTKHAKLLEEIGILIGKR